MNVQRAVGLIILGCLYLVVTCGAARADGGSVWGSEKHGAFKVTIFTSPSPFRAGPVDISVLVQDSKTGVVVSDVLVTVHITQPNRSTLEFPATSEIATNKLLRAAQFNLPRSGRWELQVDVIGEKGLVTVQGEIEVADPLPGWSDLWVWIGWPAPVIMLFGIHQLLVHRTSNPTRLDGSGSKKEPARR